MGSNYFGERGAGLSSSSTSSQSSSSRKGKKNGSDKPKQPQRGLGVAQLEKIRLHSQLGCNYVPSVHNPYAPNLSQEDIRMQTAYSASSQSFSYSSSISPSYGFQGSHGVMMGLPDLDRSNVRYGDVQPTNVARWHQGNAGFGHQQFMDTSMTRSFFEQEGSLKKNHKDRDDSMGSDEIDLELRLSL